MCSDHSSTKNEVAQNCHLVVYCAGGVPEFSLRSLNIVLTPLGSCFQFSSQVFC